MLRAGAGDIDREIVVHIPVMKNSAMLTTLGLLANMQIHLNTGR